MPLAAVYKPDIDAKLELITTPDAAELLAKDLRKLGPMNITVAFDCETVGHDIRKESPAHRAQSVCWSLCFEEDRTFYIHNSDNRANMIRAFKPWFEDANCRKEGHNVKYDMHVVENYGIQVRGVMFDTMVAAWVVDEDRPLGLESLAYQEFGEEYATFKETFGYHPLTKAQARRHKTAKTPSLADVLDIRSLHYQPRKLAKYATKDAWLTKRLGNRLRTLLDNILWLPAKDGHPERSMYDYYKWFEQPFTNVLYDMERSGTFVDREHVEALNEEWIQQKETAERKFFRNLVAAGVDQSVLTEFNMNSDKQMVEMLFTTLGLPPGETTKSGNYSVKSDVIEGLVKAGHTVVEPLLECTFLDTLITKYSSSLPNLLDDNGRVYTNFKQTGTKTGRLSSSTPNLQNIPADSQYGSLLRMAFGAEKHRKLVVADLSQIEYRMMAHFSKDKYMIEGFQAGKDFHQSTAERLFDLDGLDEGERKDKRKAAKTINFGLLYGQGVVRLAASLGISTPAAKRMLNSYFAQFPAVLPFKAGTEEFAKKYKHVRTWARRYRHLTRSLESPDEWKRAKAMREAVNSVIQGSAADWVKAAMIALNADEELRELDAVLHLQIHDELVMSCPDEPGVPERVKELLVYYMEHPYKHFGWNPLRCPVKADCNIALNWAEAK